MKTIESVTKGNPLAAESKTLSLTDRSYLRKAPFYTVAINNTVIENYTDLESARKHYFQLKESF